MFGDIGLPNSLEEIVWVFPTALAVVAFIQVIYYLFLSSSAQLQETARPNRPVMPQLPHGWSSGGMGSLPSNLPSSLLGEGLPSLTGVSGDGAAGRFVVMAGLANIKDFQLPGSEFGIGRFQNVDQGITLPIDEKSISRYHAAFTADEALREYYLMDTNSTYGTFLLKSGQFEQLPPNQQVRVYNDDVVQFGSKVRVRLVLPSETREEAIR